jgi:hypothetical protein
MSGMVHRLVRCLVATVLVAAASTSASYAQESRGSISGVITDSAGGVLPGVTVTVTANDTRVSQTVLTDAKGAYQVPLLNAGTYTVTAELSGLQTAKAEGDVRVGEVLRVDLKMSPGGVRETVEVTAESPLLNTTSGISGTTVTAKQIGELPLGDGTAYMLTRLAPGIVDNSDLHFARPMDNGNLAGIVSNGAQGGNEFTIDGAPNLSNAKGVGFSPPSGAIAEFKVQTNAFDAQSGHTAGATVNLAIRSGSNDLHGEAAYFNRDASRTATPLLTERAGGTKPTRTYNRETATVEGPIARNRTFFMFSTEFLRDVQPEPSTMTVPTDKMRNGDFSEFPTLIYNPFSATGSSATRTPFQNNAIPPGMISRVAAAYAALYPEPNRPGVQANYFTNMLRPYDYHAYMGRIDENLSPTMRLFGTVYYNKRREDRYNWALGASNAPDGVINGFPVTQGYDYRSNTGVSTGFTMTQSNSSVLDVRVSVTQFGEWRDPAATFDPGSLGFSSTAKALMGNYQYLPFFTFGSFSTTPSNQTITSLGATRSDWNDGFSRPMTTVSIMPTWTHLTGSHSIRAGYELRRQRWNITNDGYPAGRYSFNGAYTRLNNSAPTNDEAQSWAQFLLGLPTVANGAVAAPGTASSQFEIASPGSFLQLEQGLFLQDDWRMNRSLTLNLGVRVEVNGGMSESQNRNLAGYDFSTASPIQTTAQANYAAHPIPEIAPSDFKVIGGLKFANGPVNETKTKVLPRAAAAYTLTPRTVVRGGIGLFSYDYFFENINQAGFSQPTPVVVTTDNGLTFTGATLENPIPSGVLTQPTGNALGLSSQLGNALGTLYQPNRESPFYTRWEMTLQRDLGGGWLVQGSYVGSRGRKIPVTQAVNNIPYQYLSTLPYRDTAQESFLSTNVTSPFTGLLPGSTINGATVARSQLLRPYPQFQAFSLEQYTGSDKYDSATVQAEKRFRSGNSLTLQYTRSAARDRLNYLNPSNGVLEDRVSPNDRPNRFAVGTSLLLPFGHGERWGADWSTLLDSFAGGWQVSATFEYQTGFPVSWNNVYYDPACGDPAKLVSNIGAKVNGGIAGLDSPAWNTSCFYFHDAAVQTNGVDDPAKQRADPRIQLGNNVRTYPSTLPDVRNEPVKLLDVGLFKNFRLGRTARAQVRIEAINALNYTVLWAPDANPRNSTFGYTTTDRNNPRDVQLGLRFTF